MTVSSKPKRPSGNWKTFLRNHVDQSWGIDFFTVATACFNIHHVFVIFDHGRRRVVDWAVTEYPTSQWIVNHLRDAMPWGIQPKYLFRDNDKKYGNAMTRFLHVAGIEDRRTAYRCPWQNPYVERFIGSVKRDLLDHVVVLNEKHLKKLLGEYVDFYHTARPHQGLNGETPIRSPAPMTGPPRQSVEANRALPQVNKKTQTSECDLISIPVLGGLHHKYVRVA